jgi:hypothetical protein
MKTKMLSLLVRQLAIAALTVVVFLAVSIGSRSGNISASPTTCDEYNYFPVPYGGCEMQCTTKHCEWDGGIVTEQNHTVIHCDGYDIDYGWNDGGCFQ